ncbi:MAG: hypothetical protein ACRD19_09795 [Terriglobia bacterium]
MMKNKIAVKSLLGAAVTLIFATGLMFAKGENINIIYRGQVGNNLTLAPGNYKMSINMVPHNSEAMFYKDGKLVGATPVKIVAESNKNSQTEIYYSSPDNHVRQITEIDLNGKRNRLMFKHS